MTPRWMQHTAAAIALAILVTGGLYLSRPAYHPEPHHRIAVLAGPFELKDQHERRFTQTDLIGEPTLLVFGVTRCPKACSSMLACT